jgi:acetoin utilization protein AcuB
MLVKDCMTRHPILVPPTMQAAEAQKIMSENNVRHLPVTGDGKRFLGLLTRNSLSLKGEALGSLNVWEITRFLSGLTVQELMIRAMNVHTIEPGKTVERAARIMSDHKIGCLPVIEENIVIGLLSEIDVLRSFQEMLGLSAQGIRITMRMPDRAGEFVKLTAVLAAQGWGIMGIGTFPSPRCPGYYDAVLKIPHISLAEAEAVFNQVPDQKIMDIREVV